MHRHPTLRSRKKYSVYDLRQLKGKRCLTHIHVKSAEEAAAAEAAGIDLLSCSFDSPAAQARLPLLVEAAPNSFISGSTPHGLASQEEAVRIGFRALEMGASSVYCSASPWLHASGNQALFASAFGGAERGASGGWLLAACGQQQLRE
jgi:3-methyl-2-oxobutanoate hydroxymethyltransferase